MPISDYSASQLEPHKLTKEEIENPLLVIQNLFEYGHLPQIREMLWDLLKTATTGSYHKQTLTERANIFSFYEKMEKLIDAAWLLHKKTE